MQRSKTQTSVDVLGVLGYISLAFQWLWALVLLLPWLLAQEMVMDTLHPSTGAQEIQQPVFSVAPSPIVAAIAVAFSVILVGFALWYTVVKAPKRYIKGTSHATHKTASKLAVSATKHHPVSKRQLNILTERMVFGLKMAAVVVAAAVITWAAWFLPIGLSRGLAFAIGIVLTAWPLLWFGLQFMVARFGARQKIRIF